MALQLVVGVRFKKAGKIYHFSGNNLELKIGDSVLVDTIRGIEYGTVVTLEDKELDPKGTPLKSIVKVSSDEEYERHIRNKKEEEEIIRIGSKKIAEHKLDMSLRAVEYTFDRSKLIFYFTSEERIDFRKLVVELASIFKTRIELRQIGVRDGAKILGGYGTCGRQLCCNSFLSEFDAVSIKMAKNQMLSLNPNKISGSCGRLKCCLKYEDEAYEELRYGFPKQGTIVQTAHGEGKVDKIFLLKKEVVVRFEEGGFEKFPISEIKVKKKPYNSQKKNKKCSGDNCCNSKN